MEAKTEKKGNIIDAFVAEREMDLRLVQILWFRILFLDLL